MGDWAFPQDFTSDVPEPFRLSDWVTQHQEELAKGAELSLFGKHHPDKEAEVLVIGGGSTQTRTFEYETFFYQLRGSARLSLQGRAEEVLLPEDGCFVVDAGVQYTVHRELGSIGMVVTLDPRKNKI